jgi:LCP family protein required for cell wall assembly
MPQDQRVGRGEGETRPGRTIARVIAASLLSLAVVTGLGVVLIYDNWSGNIDRVSMGDQVKHRPPKAEVTGPQEPMNILVMGSDTRLGEGNGRDGETGGGVSDTTILFHLSADREFAYGISIPRDTAVMRPACYEPDGSEIPAATTYDKWNAAFAIGGPFCTVQQFEQLTDIRVDNYLVVDFNQFKDMVNALDGVEVCIPQDIHDPDHDVHLEAGTRELRGEEALDYVRVRYGISGGIDPNRTRR